MQSRFSRYFLFTLIIFIGYSCKNDPASTTGTDNSNTNKEPNSQSGWDIQTSGTTENLTSVFFTDTNHGFIVGAKGTILKTVDGGTRWEKQSIGISNDLTKVYFFDAKNGSILGNNKTYFRTTDGGETWINSSNNIQIDFSAISFYTMNNGVSVGKNIGTDSSSIFVTKNGGAKWELLSVIKNSMSPVLDANVTPQFIHYEDENNFAVFGTGISETQVFNTTNGGNSWRAQYLFGTGKFSAASFIDSKNGFILAYQGMTTEYWGTVHKTTNGGLTWQQLSNMKLPQCKSIFMLDSYIGYVVGNSQVSLGNAKQNGIFKTINGCVDWDKLVCNTENQLNDVYFTDAKTGTIVGDKGTILRTTNGGILK